MRIGFDVDGVLSQFNDPFIALIKERTGIQLPPESDSYPDTWNYDLAGGVSTEQHRELWNEVAKSYNFFLRLKPYPEAVGLMQKLSAIETLHDLYFITSRPGGSAKFQSEAWLLKFFTLPTVLISSNKGPVVRGLNLDLFVDDKPENCNEVAEATEGKCLVLMPERPWNRNIIVDARVKRVKNLEKVLEGMLWPDGVPVGKLPLIRAEVA